ncbi:hypothetical protein Pla144_01350 [Bythopirellula polymerisocia]|uniref:Uncharacterized protein n=1 Tax=Bythopirellula polymerisocia TaxID=2528003 RepID=A0A5C6D3C1_9BACT|nr:hypothetical protein Pla144_01350 [Bythopirellula polymerisocia]
MDWASGFFCEYLVKLKSLENLIVAVWIAWLLSPLHALAVVFTDVTATAGINHV